MNPYLSLIQRDLRLSLGHGSEGLVAVFFFMLVASLFPFAFGGDAALLKIAAPGIIWVAALLAALLSLDGLYHRDFDDGTFDLMLVSQAHAAGIILSKMLAHWLMSGLPLVLAAVIVSQMLLLPPAALGVLVPSLVIGTIYLSLLGGMGAVLTLGSRRPALLLVFLILPLLVPMLVLGILAMEAGLTGMSARPYLLLQSALALAALPLAPWAASIFLDMHVKS